MAPKKTAMKSARKSTRSTTTGRKSEKLWSDVERDAMKASVRERNAAARRDPANERAEGEREVLDKIAELAEPERSMAKRIHTLVTTTVPSLVPRTFYGMPAYSKDGKVICFFQAASKFKVRYSTFGFQPEAKLDDGSMWPVSFALPKLTSADEKRIAQLVKKAVS
jgi:uncharacterized protein YdhG (YjbR/CyaY superfamily)